MHVARFRIRKSVLLASLPESNACCRNFLTYAQASERRHWQSPKKQDLTHGDGVALNPGTFTQLLHRDTMPSANCSLLYSMGLHPGAVCHDCYTAADRCPTCGQSFKLTSDNTSCVCQSGSYGDYCETCMFESQRLSSLSPVCLVSCAPTNIHLCALTERRECAYAQYRR